MLKSRYHVLFIVVLLSALTACQTIEPNIPPSQAPSPASEAERAYEQDYRLTKGGSWITRMYFEQGDSDDRFTPALMDSVFRESSSLAYDTYRSGNTMSTIGGIVSGIGGFLIGYPLGSSLASGEFDQQDSIVLASGAGVSVVGAILFVLADRRYQTAATEYNNSLRQSWGIE